MTHAPAGSPALGILADDTAVTKDTCHNSMNVLLDDVQADLPITEGEEEPSTLGSSGF